MNRLQQLIEDVSAISLIDVNQIKTLLYWSVATYGHPVLNKFPVLRVTGDSETGKSDLCEVLRDICRPPAVFEDIKPWSEAGIRRELNKAYLAKGTCVFDEADDFPYEYYEMLFEKNRSTHKNSKQVKGEWQENETELWCPLALNGRTSLNDVSRQTRTIEIKTVHQPQGASESYDYGMFERYRALCENIGTEIDWSEVKFNQGRRIEQKWSPLRAVAIHLGDESFLSYVEEQFESYAKELEEERAGELHPQVFNAVKEICYECVEDPHSLGDWTPYPNWEHGQFPQRIKYKDIQKRIPQFNSRDIGSAIDGLGFEKIKSGVWHIQRLTSQKLKEVMHKKGYTDEWVDGIAV